MVREYKNGIIKINAGKLGISVVCSISAVKISVRTAPGKPATPPFNPRISCTKPCQTDYFLWNEYRECLLFGTSPSLISGMWVQGMLIKKYMKGSIFDVRNKDTISAILLILTTLNSKRVYIQFSLQPVKIVSVPSTQPSDMELVPQYYERLKKYKRKFTPTKPINQKISRPKLNCMLQHAYPYRHHHC
ncbi:hypothetical protein BDB01DRAFT_865736 [Pilobolus umbonatus]|nr:hypothetical protein BDB01DRAFT_865736 [Pilobolus umbonatus]